MNEDECKWEIEGRMKGGGGGWEGKSEGGKDKGGTGRKLTLSVA